MQYKDVEGNIVNVRPNKCWKGMAVNSFTDEQRAAVGLFPLDPPEPVEISTIDRIKQLDQMCRSHIDDKAHWTAGPMIFEKAAANKPKSKAIKDWTEACWAQYYTNKALLEGGAPYDEAMATYPEFPGTTSMSEAMVE